MPATMSVPTRIVLIAVYSLLILVLSLVAFVVAGSALFYLGWTDFFGVLLAIMLFLLSLFAVFFPIRVIWGKLEDVVEQFWIDDWERWITSKRRLISKF